jgi:hypothetical protein
MSVEQPAIAIAPVGEMPVDVLRALLPAIEARFPGRVARLAKGGLPRPDDALAAGRRQYHAGPILGRLIRLRLDAERFLSVADLDLFTPGLNFIFGHMPRTGQIGQGKGVDLLDRAGEVRMDLKAVEVTDDEQRRVLQGFAVLLELLVGGAEIAVPSMRANSCFGKRSCCQRLRIITGAS